MEYLIGLLIGAAICGVIGMAIGDLGGKKNGPLGGLLGALLGPIGWIIVAVLPPAEGKEEPAKPAKLTEQDRIAKLEAELAALKGTLKAPAKSAVQVRDDDGEIPTYKLD